MKRTRGTGVLAAAVIAGSAATGAGITAALTSGHGEHHLRDGHHGEHGHPRHLHVSFRCADAPHATGELEVEVEAVAPGATGVVVVRGVRADGIRSDETSKRKELRKRRGCRRTTVVGERFTIRFDGAEAFLEAKARRVRGRVEQEAERLTVEFERANSGRGPERSAGK